MNNPQDKVWSSLVAQQQRLEAIEAMLDTVNPRTLKTAHLGRLEFELNDIIEEVRDIPNETVEVYFKSREQVLTNLKQARKYLHFAVDQSIEEKASPSRFYKSLRECQVFLSRALEAYSRIG